MTERSISAFSGYRFPDDIIALAVRWYLRYRLSYAEVVEWLAERGIMVDPSTIYDWVRAFTPRFIDAARTHRAPIGSRWQVDETYLKIGSRWRYLDRAIDEHGQIVDVFLSDRRTADAARTFFQQAFDTGGVTPTRVTTDKAKSYPKALQAKLPDVEHRCSKCLKNGIERDHQHLKGRVRPMRRFGYPQGGYRWRTRSRGDAWNLSCFQPSAAVYDGPVVGAGAWLLPPVRRSVMSLHPQAVYLVPEETARVARAAFPKGNNLAMRMRDHLGAIFGDQQFADLVSATGQPAVSPHRLAFHFAVCRGIV